MSSFFSGRDNSAVEDLLSQAKDLYVLEQVAKINCAGFSDDSALPSNLESRFRRLKSLPVSSSSGKLLSHSKSMASYAEKKNRAGNVSSVSAFSNQVGKSCPLDSSVEETRIFSGTKRTPSVSSRSELGESSDSRRIGSSSSRFSRGNVSSVSALSNFSGKSCPLDSSLEETQILSGIKHNPRVNSRGVLGDFSDSGRIGSSSSRYSRQGNVLTPTTQTLKLVPQEKSRISSHSSTSSTELASPSSDQDQKEGMKRKSKSKLKSKFLYSWFDKLSPAQALGCFRHTPNNSSPNSKRTTGSSNKEVYWKEELKKAQASFKETEQVLRKANQVIKRSKSLIHI